MHEYELKFKLTIIDVSKQKYTIFFDFKLLLENHEGYMIERLYDRLQIDLHVPTL